MTIVRQVVSQKDRSQRALLEAHSSQSDKIIDYALLLVDPAVKHSATLTNLVAHELGHSMGLMDCPKCKGQTTAMGMLKAGSESNGIDGPTSCDQQEVMATFKSQKPRASSTLALALNHTRENQGQ